MQRLPPLSADLVEQLPSVFPTQDARSMLAMSEKETGFYLGTQAVIEFLQMRQQQTKDDALVHAKSTEG